MSVNPSPAFDLAQRAPSASDSRVFRAINTLFAELKVSDALLRIARTISDKRRRASESNSSQRWWPEFNRELSEMYIAPLLEEFAEIRPTHGYLHNPVDARLRAANSVLLGCVEETPLPTAKTDGQLIDEYLEPALSLLCESIEERESGTPQGALALQICQIKPRDALKSGAGRELIAMLEQLVEGEPRSAPPLRVTRDESMFGLPGVSVEMTHEEAAEFGLGTEEDAVSLEDVWESQPDIISFVELPLLSRRLGWFECETAAKSVLLATCMLQQRIEAKRARRQSADLGPTNYSHLPIEQDDPRSSPRTFAEPIALPCSSGQTRPRRSTGEQRGTDFSFIVMTALQEGAGDLGFRHRFFSGLGLSADEGSLLDHTSSCPFCSGRALKASCLDPNHHNFAELFAYHANIRKVATKLANSHHASGIAWALDEAVQRGQSLREVGRFYGLQTDKAIGQHSGLALARLLHQKVGGAEAAARLGISPSAVSQRRSALTGCFDFALNRHWALRWWPFDDIAGANVIKFPTRAFGSNWRHAPAEYEHLRSGPKLISAHLRTGNSSSLPTRSSARRWV